MLGNATFEMAILLPTLLLVAVLGAGLFAIAKARRWHDETDPDADSNPVATLERYRQMAEDGELDPKELAAIEARLRGETKPAPPAPQEPVDDPPPRP